MCLAVPGKILTVEDSLIDRKQLELLLSKSTLPPFEIKHTEYLENASALLNTNDFDTAIKMYTIYLIIEYINTRCMKGG